MKNITTINVANLANGIYFIRVTDSKGVVVTKKFVKG
ncbi:MAG: T9SS type A sorting domain-containing protein [Bacteroidales bacterium]|nr:T9SS type A sorting domain-containing protein [Bacteroidales bacterium]